MGDEVHYGGPGKSGADGYTCKGDNTAWWPPAKCAEVEDRRAGESGAGRTESPLLRDTDDAKGPAPTEELGGILIRDREYVYLCTVSRSVTTGARVSVRTRQSHDTAGEGTM